MLTRVIRALQGISFRGQRDRREEIPFITTPTLSASLFEARDVDDEAIAHVVLEHALVGLVDLIDRDHLDIGGDSLLAAEVEHLLRLVDPTNG